MGSKAVLWHCTITLNFTLDQYTIHLQISQVYKIVYASTVSFVAGNDWLDININAT
jgi:hypothetical protein